MTQIPPNFLVEQVLEKSDSKVGFYCKTLTHDTLVYSYSIAIHVYKLYNITNLMLVYFNGIQIEPFNFILEMQHYVYNICTKCLFKHRLCCVARIWSYRLKNDYRLFMG